MKTFISEILGGLVLFLLLRAAAWVVDGLSNLLFAGGTGFFGTVLHYAATFTAWAAWVVLALALLGAVKNSLPSIRR